MADPRIVEALLGQQTPERLSVLPHPRGVLQSEGYVSRGSVMNTPIAWDDWIAPQALAEVGDAFLLPGRVAQGEDVPIADIQKMALTWMGGGMGLGRAPQGSFGMFIGAQSKKWDAEAARRAVEMERAGRTPREIWTDTGTMRGPENALRQELSDHQMDLTPSVYDAKPQWINPTIPLSEGLSHRELQDAYPQFFTPQTRTGPYQLDAKQYPSWLEGSGQGSHADPTSVSQGKITLRATSPEKLRAQVAHELQHAVQYEEGWSKGGWPEQFISQSTHEVAQRHPELTGAAKKEAIQLRAFEHYRQLAAEIEARTTANRVKMTSEERRTNFPDSTSETIAGQPVTVQDHWRFPPFGSR